MKQLGISWESEDAQRQSVEEGSGTMSEQTGTIDGLEQLFGLEEKIQQTIELLKTTRSEKEGLQRENEQLRQSLAEQTKAARTLEERAGKLEKEREAVRARVQRLVEQVDAATAARAEA
jgi:FtsZ-binding cell division protein ZapB